MLDNLTSMHERDTQDALGAVERQAQQLREPIVVPQLPPTATSIVVCGTGAVQVAAEMVRTFPGTNVPIEVVLGELPAYAQSDTLCIVTDFGNDEAATAGVLADVKARGLEPVILTHAGLLSDANRYGEQTLVILPHMQTLRFNILLIYRALLAILSEAGLLATNEDVLTLLADSETWLAKATETWSWLIPSSRNAAKALAYEIISKSVVISSGQLLTPATVSWKLALNESAKHIAWTSIFPMASHSELVGWTGQPVDKPYAIIELRSELDQLWIQKQMEVSERLLSGLRPSSEIVIVQGETLLQQLLWATYLGSYVAVYVALLNGVNPTPTDIYTKFNARMESR